MLRTNRAIASLSGREDPAAGAAFRRRELEARRDFFLLRVGPAGPRGRAGGGFEPSWFPRCGCRCAGPVTAMPTGCLPSRDVILTNPSQQPLRPSPPPAVDGPATP